MQILYIQSSIKALWQFEQLYILIPPIDRLGDMNPRPKISMLTDEIQYTTLKYTSVGCDVYCRVLYCLIDLLSISDQTDHFYFFEFVKG